MLTPISIIQLVSLSIGYLLTLFAAAWLAEKKLLPHGLVTHPVVYILSLGVYASAWAFLWFGRSSPPIRLWISGYLI